MADRPLTELDYCVLAVIARRQPCTAYAIRREFQTSLTESWRASTGSIYPLLRKLVASGRVQQADMPNNARKAKLLSLTTAGKDAVHQWLITVSDALAAPVADPIRTRAHILASLPPEDARQLVQRWHDATARTIAAIEERLDNDRQIGNKPGEITLRGTQLQLQARLRWLEELGARQSSPSDQSRGVTRTSLK